ncbi:MAG: hypothetical protein CK547_04615 [Chitinophagaceae bacterium]|nr:MAG: hypothetical protein CK547_04615 [Chitinophagaceae bacterium]
MKITKLPFLLLTFQFLISCGLNNDAQQADLGILIDEIAEGDTLSITQLAPNLNDWMKFYHTTDNEFKLSRFKSSGVVLHFNDMKSVDSLYKSKLLFSSLFSLSPNKKKYIDFLSYGNRLVQQDSFHSNEKGQLFLEEEADQQVILGNIGGERKELMFNGPARLVESADWITDNQILITLISEEENERIAEIFLFDISSQEYVNYRLDHPFKAPSSFKESFIKQWLHTKQINIE